MVQVLIQGEFVFYFSCLLYEENKAQKSRILDDSEE